MVDGQRDLGSKKISSILFTCAVTCNVLWSYVVMHLNDAPDALHGSIPFYLGFILAAFVLLNIHRFVKSVVVTGWQCLTVAMAMSMATMLLQLISWYSESLFALFIMNALIAIVDVVSVTFAYLPLLIYFSRMTVMAAVLIAHVTKALFAWFYPVIGTDVIAVLTTVILPILMALCVVGGLRCAGDVPRPPISLGALSLAGFPLQMWFIAAAIAAAVVLCDFMSGQNVWLFGSVSPMVDYEGIWAGLAECFLGAVAALLTTYYGRERFQVARYQPYFCIVLVTVLIWLCGGRFDGEFGTVSVSLIGTVAVYVHIALWILTYDLVHDGRIPLLTGYGFIFITQSLVTLAWRVSELIPGATDILMMSICGVVMVVALLVPATNLWQPSAYSLTEHHEGGQAETSPKSIDIPGTEGVVTPLRKRCNECGDKFDLTEREKEVLFLLAQGRTRQAIMERLVISEGTVRTHISHLYSKMSIHSQGELADIVYGTEGLAESEKDT